MIRRQQSIATQEGLPIWLEATTAYSQKLYTKLGFQTVQTIVLGKGKAASDGTRMRGGAGVEAWAMIWWPPKNDQVEEGKAV
jgi:hypothetical protein